MASMLDHNAPAMSRPSFVHRSISDVTPLIELSSKQAPNASQGNAVPGLSGTRVRASNLISGGHLKLGGRVPFSPLLPMPPASTLEDIGDLDFDFYNDRDGGNLTPKAEDADCSSTLASRRQAKRGASDGICPSCMNTMKQCATVGQAACSSRRPLQVDTKTIPMRNGSMQPPASRSAGMIRSYSMPVASQKEFEEQQRIMALGVSPVGAYVPNPSWWSYGFASPGGAPLHYQRRPSVGPAPHERILSPPRLAAPMPVRSKVSPSSSPKGKAAYGSPRVLPKSPKAHRSPLGSMSLNLAPSEQQQERRASNTSSPLATKRTSLLDRNSPTRSPLRAPGRSIDLAVDSLSNGLVRCRTNDEVTGDVSMDEDYFSPRKGSASTSDAGSEEALTPRAASPSPCMRTGSLGLDFGITAGDAGPKQFGSPLKQASTYELDIHPDHLQALPPFDL